MRFGHILQRVYPVVNRSLVTQFFSGMILPRYCQHYFTFLGRAELNLYSHLFSIRFLGDGTWVVIPVLIDAFFRLMK